MKTEDQGKVFVIGLGIVFVGCFAKSWILLVIGAVVVFLSDVVF